MTITELNVPQPWRALLVSVTSFPVPSQADRVKLLEGVRHALAELRLPEPATSATFLQLWNLTPDNGGTVLQQNIASWQPEFGMGIWPTRKPPEGWTETSLMDNAAAVILGEEPGMPNHRILRLHSDTAVQQRVERLLRGFGTLIQIQTSLPLPVVLQSAQELFLPSIKEERFKDEPFYLPLIDVATLSAATNVAELDRWMCGVSGYVRESSVDAGVLIVARSAMH